MGKKRRNSILRRPDSAAGDGAPEKGTKVVVVNDVDKENQVRYGFLIAGLAISLARILEYSANVPLWSLIPQAMGSGSGTDSEASGPVTRKKNKRRVSFGAHIGTP